MNKQKTLPVSPFSPFVRLLKIIFGLLASVVCAYGALMSAYISIGSLETSPNPALQLTTEFLYAHPQATLEYIEVDYDAAWQLPHLCYIKIAPQEDNLKTPLETSSWNEVFLNGSRVPPSAILQLNAAMPGAPVYQCFNTDRFSPGLHLIALHVRQTPWETPIIYQWVVKMKNGKAK